MPSAGRLVAAANHALGADRVSLFLIDPLERELWCAVSDDIEGWRLAPGTGIAGHVARTGIGVNAADARALEFFDPRLDRVLSYTTRSVLCLPVVDPRGRVLAVIQVRSQGGRRCPSMCVVYLLLEPAFLAPCRH